MAIQNLATTPSTMLLTDAVNRLSTQQADLQGQVSSGVTSDSYAGLGDQRYAVLDLQSQITGVTAWQGNITSAQTTLDVTQTAMTQITSIASSLQDSLTSLVADQSATNVSAVAAEARQSLTELTSLLNTKNGAQYVFAGNDAGTPPVTDASTVTSSSFFQTIASSVAAVGVNGAAATESSTVAAASNNAAGEAIFSPFLSVAAASAAASVRSVTVGEQDHVAVGFVATQGGAPTATSTGSSIRDLMRTLAVAGSLDQADTTSAGFSTLITDTRSQLDDINQSLVASVASLGQTQAGLADQSSALSDVGNTLTKQLGSLRDSDPALLSTQLTETQNQLQASYSLIADMKGMSLAAYL